MVQFKFCKCIPAYGSTFVKLLWTFLSRRFHLLREFHQKKNGHLEDNEFIIEAAQDNTEAAQVSEREISSPKFNVSISVSQL